MRWTAAILILSVAGNMMVFAADDPRRAQVAAATADALAALREDLLSARVTAGITVEEFVEKTDAHDELAKALKRAEQIGGTRWLDDETCQVRMQLRGSELADALVQIAAAHPREAGLPPDLLRRRVAGLGQLTFAATGMSTRAVDGLRPAPDQEAWRDVPEDAVRSAVNEARRSAARQIVQSVADLELPNGAALGQLFEDPKVRDALEGWAMNRPVTSVEFQPDLEVRITVAASGEDFWDELVATVGDDEDLPFPEEKDDAARGELRRRVLERVEPAVGRARAAAPGAGATQPDRANEMAAIPLEPPRWVSQYADAKGVATPVNGRLKTARAAEKAARKDLLREVEALPLSRQLSLGAAARQDPRIRDVIDRALRRAKVSKVNYLAGGSAEVSLSIDLRELWYELDELP